MTLPDGSNPSLLAVKWGPWVTEALDMMDGDGAFAHLPRGGGRDEQLAYDMSVLRLVRAEWVRLRNAKYAQGQ